jgi:hypothetical protein
MSKQMGVKMSGYVFAAIFGLSLLAATILLMTPGSTTVEAREDAGCRTVPVQLDEGYSISRIEMRQVCGFDR